MSNDASPFSLLLELYPAPQMSQALSKDRLVEHWTAFEHALAGAQARLGIISPADAEQIRSISAESINQEDLWETSKNVGYPILSLVRQIAGQLPDGPDGRVHFGTTTQDVMDTAQALQLRDARDILAAQVSRIGDGLTRLVAKHSKTAMPGRTHGQQAVPTTFGAHLAPLLGELSRTRSRLHVCREAAATVSLYGAGGTSAALGSQVREIRSLMAEELGLHSDDVSWHTARDRVVEVAQVCMILAGTCARLARNVIDLSRSEIAEVFEAAGNHRGASSTMPQKANPILSEGIIGMSAIIGPLTASLGRTMEMPQERSAGEWQIEWHVIPQVLQLTSSTMAAAEELLDGIRIDDQAMAKNLTVDGGLIMAEASMIGLADELGREHAHDIVYAAAQAVRSTGTDLATAIGAQLEASGNAGRVTIPGPEDYLGEAAQMCESAIGAWAETGGA
ncbi:lyase family protein [Brevibacterium sp. CT2-23B]|uniref:lyase family protein n=1 Tax=Brevibacterium sp. CT2-23B TaxID=2729630 RepID=UPI0015568F0C|nr:lyase family protein [Brevibacterium sp. CT2-23B]